MLFTIGTGYFLWVSDNNASYSHALATRGTALQNQQEESLNVTAGLLQGKLEVSISNMGGIAVNIVDLFVTLPSGDINTYGQGFQTGLPLPFFVSEGATNSQIVTGITPIGQPGTYTVKLLTERGNTFGALYNQPAAAISLQLLPSSTVAVGALVTGAAELTGVLANPGGTVQYQYFTGLGCSGTPTSAGSPVTVTAGPLVPDSVAVPFSSAGQFSWNAVYNDAPNPTLTSSCESLTVQASPTVSTTLSTSLAAVNGQVSDTATIVGGSADPEPGGYVTFYFSSSDTCPSSGATEVGVVEVVDGVAAPSGPYTFASAGYYYWYAVYSGDQYNVGSTSTCEQLTVGSIPTITTALAASSVGTGVATDDSATISGAANNPDCPPTCAAVTFYYTSTPICPATSGATMVGTPVVVSESDPNGVYTSSMESIGTQGTYYWYAVYSGDPYNIGTTSPCETMTVGTAITTTLSQGTILTGESVTDQALLEPPGGTGTLGGTVTYYYFSGSSCSGPSTQVGTAVTVTDGLVPPSESVVFPTGGPFSWDAVYSDAPNPTLTSPCEPLTVISSTGSNSPPSPIGSLAEVLGSFKFYFTTCNQASSSGSNPECLGDGGSVGGYYGYGLSMATAGSSCPYGGFFGIGANPSCVNVVFQITLTNTDPTRSITLGPQSLLWLQGTCQTASGEMGFFFFGEGHCSSSNPFSEPLSQGYWIVDGPPTSSGQGATPLPYSTPVTIAPGAEATLYFYCGGPCTNQLSAPDYNPPPGTYVEAALDLYGLYSTNVPFGQSIPFIASYVSPVQIVGCAVGTTYPGSTCWPNPTNPDLTATAESSVTLAVDGLPCTSVTTTSNGFGGYTSACASGDTFPLYAYWVNSAGGVSEVGTNPSCSYSDQAPDGSPGYCTVTFQVPPNAEVGSYYAVYVTSDGVNNAYATVYIPQVSVLTTSLLPSGTVTAGTSVQDSATLSDVTANAGGSVTYYYTSSSSCSATGATAAGTVTVTDGAVPNSLAHTFSTSGTYYWFAVYTGDANNAPSTSQCETLSVQNSFTFTAPALISGANVPGSTAIGTITVGGTGATCAGGVVTTVTESMLGSSGYVMGVSPGSDVCYSFVSPVASNSATEQYVWSSASGTGSASGQTGQTGSFTINANSEVTGNYAVQYQVTFVDAPSSGGSITAGGTAEASGSNAWENAGSLAVSASANGGYAFTSWSSSTGSITFAGATSSSTTATIAGSGTITANFGVTNTLTVAATPVQAASGVSGGTTVLTLTIGGTGATCTGGTATSITKTMLDTTGYSTSVLSGSDVCYSYSSPVASSGGIQYVWASTTGSGSAAAVTTQTGSFTITSTSSVTATYNTQYQVTFATSGLDSSATGTVVTINGNPVSYSALPYSLYVASGSSVTFTWSSPVSSSTSGKQFLFASSSQSSPYPVTGTITITGTYTPQYRFTLSDSGIGSDTTTTVATITVGGTGTTCNGGTTASLTQSQLSYTTGYISTGTRICYSFSSPVPTTASTKQYVWSSTSGTGSASAANTQTGSFTLSAVSSVTGTYLTQYQVSFVVSPAGEGTTSPSGTSVWENSGSLTITATADSGYMFSAWSSNTGSITIAGATSSSTTANIEGTGTITAIFVHTTHVGSFDTACSSSSSTCRVTLPTGTVTSGDLLVVTVDTFVSSTTTCITVSGIADSLSGMWSASPGTVSSSNSAVSPAQCAYSYINYKSAGTSGGDTVTVTLSSSGFSSAVVVVYDLTGFTAPPSGGFVEGSSTISGCNSASGCGDPASMSTTSLSYSAGSFLIGAGTTCNSISGFARSITVGVNGFTTTYGTGDQEYAGYDLPSSSGSTTFSMTADSGSSAIACWTAIGAQFLDPPPAQSTQPALILDSLICSSPVALSSNHTNSEFGGRRLR
jgi:hypothetical protein